MLIIIVESLPQQDYGKDPLPLVLPIFYNKLTFYFFQKYKRPPISIFLFMYR